MTEDQFQKRLEKVRENWEEKEVEFQFFGIAWKEREKWENEDSYKERLKEERKKFEDGREERLKKYLKKERENWESGQ